MQRRTLASNLIDAGLTIKGAELTRAGLGILGQDGWGWVESGGRRTIDP